MLVPNSTSVTDKREELLNPNKMALSMRGRRIELRKCYQNMKTRGGRRIPREALVKQTELMIQDNRPIKSYLWKAEKEGHSVFLFGDIHKTIQKVEDFINLDPKTDDFAPIFKTFIHPDVWQVFENSEKFYVECFCFKHFNEILELKKQIETKYQTPLTQIDSLSELCEKPMEEQKASFGLGLVEYMLTIKAGTKSLIQEIPIKLDSLVIEMEDFNTQRECIELTCRLIEEGKIVPSTESLLESIDAVQWGNLDSLNLIYQDTPSELTASFELRNANFANHIFNSLEKGERAFFAPGASHFIGEKGILSLLEKRGVSITRIDLS